MGQHSEDLKKDSPNHSLICKFLEPFYMKICNVYYKIRKRATEMGLCGKCDENRSPSSKITRDLTVAQREMWTVELTKNQQTLFKLRRAVPRKLHTLWSDILTDIGLGMADAVKESDARCVLKRYLMLKALQPMLATVGFRWHFFFKRLFKKDGFWANKKYWLANK